MQSVFIDTNIFLRYYIREDKQTYLDCQKFLKKVSQGSIRAFINTLVISEVYFVAKTQYDISKSDCLMLLRNIRGYKGLTLLDSYNYSKALDIFEVNNVKFTDSFIASFQPIVDGQMPIVSYDKDFDKIPGVKRVEPSAVK